MKKFVAVCLFAVPLTAFATQRLTSSNLKSTETDPILQAMQSELDREKAALLLPGMQRPYFIEYRLDDIRSYEAVANYGALTREEEQHQRVIRVTRPHRLLRCRLLVQPWGRHGYARPRETKPPPLPMPSATRSGRPPMRPTKMHCAPTRPSKPT